MNPIGESWAARSRNVVRMVCRKGQSPSDMDQFSRKTGQNTSAGSPNVASQSGNERSNDPNSHR
jgi:hypothetical protein